MHNEFTNPAGNPHNMSGCLKPSNGEFDLVLVHENVILEAEDYVDGCEACVAMQASITFDYLLDCVTGCDPARVEYLMHRVAECPWCGGEITEKTHVLARTFSRFRKSQRRA